MHVKHNFWSKLLASQCAKEIQRRKLFHLKHNVHNSYSFCFLVYCAKRRQHRCLQEFLYKTFYFCLGFGYGFLAVLIISLMSIVCLIAFPCIHKTAFQYVLATFTALAVGTLFGDVMFHLVPYVGIDVYWLLAFD